MPKYSAESPTKQSYLDVVFPSALERCRRKLLPVAAGVRCLLHTAVSDGRVAVQT